MPEKKKARLTNERSRVQTRRAGSMYRTSRHSVYLGFNITPEMHAELVAEGKKALMRQSDFARLIMAGGLRAWHASRERAEPRAELNEQIVAEGLKALAARRGRRKAPEEGET